ncbi:hypothetical protein CEXT_173231 [Caerostris extrusa]|uniref:Uncharacterized protein n=1 Tax=Caerostris extrusa TaxID=172846 RepID=A0AAV4P4F2_CAEEX|nr:hypothetical protein CEXT_173231 [Caerostris extrusa]
MRSGLIEVQMASIDQLHSDYGSICTFMIACTAIKLLSPLTRLTRFGTRFRHVLFGRNCFRSQIYLFVFLRKCFKFLCVWWPPQNAMDTSVDTLKCLCYWIRSVCVYVFGRWKAIRSSPRRGLIFGHFR